MALQIRRGPTADRAGKLFAEGELVYDTEEKAIYIGDGTTSGGKPATTYTDERAVDAVGLALVAGTGNVVFTYGNTEDTANRINANVTLDGTYNDVVQDTSPELGGDLSLNSRNINGTGNINITGSVTATSFTGPVTGAVTGNVTGNVTGDVTGNAGTVTNGVYTSQIFYIGTESISVTRSSGVQTLAGTSIGGNAATATKLAATKNINGVAFDGSADVTVITQGTGVTVSGSTISIGQAVATTSSVTFNNVTVDGNLTVNGTTTTLNTTTLDVEDLNITVAKGAANAAAANGAGLTVDGAGATLLYASTGDKFVSNKPVDATSFTGDLTGEVTGNVTGNLTGNVTSIGSSEFRTVTISGGDATHSSLCLTGYNEARAGLGYHEFLQVNNTYLSAANPNRYFRLNSDGDLEIMDSGYQNIILSVSNDGNVTTPGTITATGTISSTAGFTGTLTGNVKTDSITSQLNFGKITVASDTEFSQYVDIKQGLLVEGNSPVYSVSGYNVVTSAVSGQGSVSIDLTNTRATFNVPVRFGSYTVIQRNALTPGNGDVIYCTDSIAPAVGGQPAVGQFLGYANGAWVSLS